jgi:hypothetical protein
MHTAVDVEDADELVLVSGDEQGHSRMGHKAVGLAIPIVYSCLSTIEPTNESPRTSRRRKANRSELAAVFDVENLDRRVLERDRDLLEVELDRFDGTHTGQILTLLCVALYTIVRPRQTEGTAARPVLHVPHLNRAFGTTADQCALVADER